MQNKFSPEKLIVGDALAVLRTLPKEYFDVGVTSPPYNKRENKKGWLVKNVIYNSASDKKDEGEYQKNQIDVLDELYRVIKSGGSFFYNHKVRWENGNLLHPLSWILKSKWTLRQEIIWDRMIAANIRGWRFWQLDERIYWLYKPKGRRKIGKEIASRHALLGSIWRFLPERKNSHPAPFPLELPARCIYSILDGEKGRVIDPYIGSGTTAIAAKLLGCKFVGIDTSNQYIREAENRIKNIDRERRKLDEELAKHKVQKTFAQRKKEGNFTGKFSPIFVDAGKIEEGARENNLFVSIQR